MLEFLLFVGIFLIWLFFYVSVVGLCTGNTFSVISFLWFVTFNLHLDCFPFCIGSIFVGLALLINKAILLA